MTYQLFKMLRHNVKEYFIICITISSAYHDYSYLLTLTYFRTYLLPYLFVYLFTYFQDKANWRVRHENLIARLRADKGRRPATAPIVFADYIECPYCNRTLSEAAAERHTAFCKDEHARRQISIKPNTAWVCNALVEFSFSLLR